MQPIHACLWFDSQAEEAANFYTSIFKNSKITTITRYTGAGPGTPGAVMTVSFELDGREFVALNGGPMFTFSEAVSFVVPCESQLELDPYWDALLEGGEASQCGWLTDKYGLSWQIVPQELLDVLSRGDAVTNERVMSAVYSMVKIDVGALEEAAMATRA
jgi:predicted 3-demethylubiquinone-9 3-methyltransferase (glyoxalase superfamily)